MDSSLPQVERPTLRAGVEETLRRAIVDGELKPSEKLVERELCEMLGVSRPSLREALRRLEAEKLIVIVPHRGPEVATVTRDDALELYAVRRLLEGHAASEFARRASDEQVERLARIVGRLKSAGGRHLRAGVLAAKADFYRLLLDGCGNALVAELFEGLLARVSLLRATSLMRPERLPPMLEEIDTLMDCIRRRDADGARRMAVRHVRHAEAAALAVMDERDGPPTAPRTRTRR